MKIGIGILTYNRIEHLELCKNQIAKYSPFEYELEIQDDSFDRKGVAYRTNKLINLLKDCDHIFIFNDDCFPIKDGWQDVYINTGFNHLLYFRENSDIEKMKTVSGVDLFSNCGGCLMYITKEVVEKVGYLHSDYGMYGYEHAGYSMRIHKAELIPHPFCVPCEAGEYIYAMDFDNYIDFGVDHKPSVNNYLELTKELNKNKVVFLQDIKTIYHPYND